MSSETAPPTPHEQPRSRLRTLIAWNLLNAFITAVAGGGLGIMIILTLRHPVDADVPWMLFLLLLSATIRQLGFPVANATNSLFGIVDLTTILLFGPLAGAWQAALSVLFHAAASLARSSQRTIWNAVRLPLFNAGLKSIMALTAGFVYLSLGGQLRPALITTALVVPGLALVLSWFVIDHLGWGALELLTGGRRRMMQWFRYMFPSSLAIELAPLPVAFLAAGIAVHLGAGGFLLFALALISASLAVRLVVQARARLEARVAELATLNRVSQEIIQASRSEQDICEIIYRYSRSVVDTTYFLLGLVSDDGTTETLPVLVADGERQEPRTLPVGGVVTWMQTHRRPLVVNDLQKEGLPFAARHVSPSSGRVRSALFVPMLAGQRLIGFISIQSDLPNSFTADDTRILSAMANQAAMAIANIRLQRQADASARLEQEVRLASDIQRSLLPKGCPAIPGFEIAAHWQSAREVSGDFYDFLSLPQGKVGIVIADVSDKGVPAALFMALSRSLVRSGLLGTLSPAEGLRRANRWIIKDASSDMFLTLFYAILDPLTSTLTYVNCGHNPPFLFRHGAQNCQPLDQHGMALGVVEEIQLEEHTVRMSTGDVLLLYTDGVTDALDPQGKAFGEERLRAVASANCSKPPAEIIACINQALAEHVAGGPAYDDATLIAVRCTGVAEPIMGTPSPQSPRQEILERRPRRWVA